MSENNQFKKYEQLASSELKYRMNSLQELAESGKIKNGQSKALRRMKKVFKANEKDAEFDRIHKAQEMETKGERTEEARRRLIDLFRGYGYPNFFELATSLRARLTSSVGFSDGRSLSDSKEELFDTKNNERMIYQGSYDQGRASRYGR